MYLKQRVTLMPQWQEEQKVVYMESMMLPTSQMMYPLLSTIS